MIASDTWSATLGELRNENKLSQQETEHLAVKIPLEINSLTYLFAHMGCHLTGSMLRYTVFPVPIPFIGGLIRLTWTAANRFFFMARRDWNKAKFHSLPVMIITLIPFIGILAYLYEIKRIDPQLAYVVGEKFCRQSYNLTLDQWFAKYPVWLSRRLRQFILPKTTETKHPTR